MPTGNVSVGRGSEGGKVAVGVAKGRIPSEGRGRGRGHTHMAVAVCGGLLVEAQGRHCGLQRPGWAQTRAQPESVHVLEFQTRSPTPCLIF